MQSQNAHEASDMELLEACRAGDSSQFAPLWERHQQAGRVAARNLAPGLDADDLVVIENGRVMETGTHDELYANHGKYYEIFNAMSDSLNLDKISQTLNS